jgi:hypothetical protein
MLVVASQCLPVDVQLEVVCRYLHHGSVAELRSRVLHWLVQGKKRPFARLLLAPSKELRRDPNLWVAVILEKCFLYVQASRSPPGAPCATCATWTDSWCNACGNVAHSLCTLCKKSGVCRLCIIARNQMKSPSLVADAALVRRLRSWALVESASREAPSISIENELRE